MSQDRIRYLLETRLANWAAARNPTLTVAWQNHPFTPPTGSYLRAFLLPATTGSNDLAGAHRRYTGVFQVSIVAPAGAGSRAAESIANELETLFPLNLALSIVSPAFRVSIISPVTIAPAIQEGDRYTVPVSFRYRSDTI